MSQSNSLSPRMQQQVARLQNTKQQLDFLSQQRAALENSARDMEGAIQELEAAEDDVVVYKSIGGILIKSEKAKLLGELKEQKENTDVRVATLSKQEERVKKNFDEMYAKIQDELKGGSAPEN
ncbi:MAG TPA: prefoldin subunit beta [Candidatus Lokiarchaeia archaeon]|nr:prefoldin subunit beta [Candidatus Lokiarchaeia archaeon]